MSRARLMGEGRVGTVLGAKATARAGVGAVAWAGASAGGAGATSKGDAGQRDGSRGMDT